jgi:hypothetical protein
VAVAPAHTHVAACACTHRQVLPMLHRQAYTHLQQLVPTRLIAFLHHTTATSAVQHYSIIHCWYCEYCCCTHHNMCAATDHQQQHSNNSAKMRMLIVMLVLANIATVMTMCQIEQLAPQSAQQNTSCLVVCDQLCQAFGGQWLVLQLVFAADAQRSPQSRGSMPDSKHNVPAVCGTQTNHQANMPHVLVWVFSTSALLQAETFPIVTSHLCCMQA